ncbi:MAG TPA: response regulator transcription factor [Chloroflexota bacterium]|nr:response regulator transcription factor [Chloroflexota bacterium]
MDDPAQAKTILVVDDEPIVVEVVGRYLHREGFRMESAATGDAALALAASVRPALIVLDVMLPGIDGVEVCRRLRESESGAMARVPIILLTARGEEADRIAGLRTGADDYVVKPFSPAELVERVKAQLRRVALDTRPAQPGDGLLRGGEVALDPAARTCVVRGEAVALSPKEFDLLHYLLGHAGQAFSRDQLLDAVWDREFFGYASTVTVHIRRLREKIEQDPDRPTHLKTVWGVGYKFDPLA